MTTVIDATFDGQVFRPSQPVSIEPNSKVRLIVESAEPTNQPSENAPKLGEPYSFLKVLRSIEINGPPDWSANIDKYLYGELHDEEPKK